MSAEREAPPPAPPAPVEALTACGHCDGIGFHAHNGSFVAWCGACRLRNGEHIANLRQLQQDNERLREMLEQAETKLTEIAQNWLDDAPVDVIKRLFAALRSSPPAADGPPWWCGTCESWRHAAPCGRDECPRPSDTPPAPPAPVETLGSAPVTWQSAAQRLGEELASVGPTGYYDLSPADWLTWALAALRQSPAPDASREAFCPRCCLPMSAHETVCPRDRAPAPDAGEGP